MLGLGSSFRSVSILLTMPSRLMIVYLAPHIDNTEISFITKPLNCWAKATVEVVERGRLISIVIDRVSIAFAAYVKGKRDREGVREWGSEWVSARGSFLFVYKFFFLHKWMNNESQQQQQWQGYARHSHSIAESSWACESIVYWLRSTWSHLEWADFLSTIIINYSCRRYS